MENEFEQAMYERTDEELIKIVTLEKNRYKPIALEAAEIEIEKRKLKISEFDEIIREAKIEKDNKQIVNSNVVGSGVRFLNYLIDIIATYLLILIVFIILGLFITPFKDSFLAVLLTIITVFGTAMSYYTIMEIKFQKTLGKFITKTKVVKLNGEKPNPSDIINRTICRFIPFDGISYLFVKNGLHDYLSKTKVIKG
ncbi:RDD family protein [Bizionia sp.]|uniref:RDD family protein n=2 Tax=Bizionia sp. TaxID=1954480 RepID=UPI003A9156EB